VIERIEHMVKRFDEITEQMADPGVLADPQRLQDLARERAELEDVVEKYREHERLRREIDDARALLDADDDPALGQLAREEIERLEPRANALLAELR
jgi:peptide chain release factor 1